MVNFGLAPFFRERLEDALAKSDQFVICIDEALNKVAQRGQNNQDEILVAKKVEIGFSTERELKQLSTKKLASELDILRFRRRFHTFCYVYVLMVDLWSQPNTNMVEFYCFSHRKRPMDPALAAYQHCLQPPLLPSFLVGNNRFLARDCHSSLSS